MIDWKPIESAPWNQQIILTGPSGTRYPHDKFICLGYRDKLYHNGAWNDVNHDRLSDQGWRPTYWDHKPILPPIE